MNYQAELDEILTQLQYGTTMSDNTEPMLTNNRIIAIKAITALNAETIKSTNHDNMCEHCHQYTEHLNEADLRQRFGIEGGQF